MKEVVREAVRKEQIVPGKIRVISIFLALIVATVVTTAVVLGDVQRKDRAVQEHLAEEVLRFHVLANSDSRKDQAEEEGSHGSVEVGGAGCSVILFKRSTS